MQMSVGIKKILYAADAKESALADAQEYLSQFTSSAETETEADADAGADADADADANADANAWVLWLKDEVLSWKTLAGRSG